MVRFPARSQYKGTGEKFDGNLVGSVLTLLGIFLFPTKNRY